jgi:excisionase family DNA binding protein
MNSNGQVSRIDPRSHDVEQYLSIPQVAERLGTSERFPRRLIEERRIEFKRFGRHVRISERVLTEYIEACSVPSRRRPR